MCWVFTNTDDIIYYVIGNYVRRIQEIRRSNAAQPHVDKHRQWKRGMGKGGRRYWKRDDDC